MDHPSKINQSDSLPRTWLIFVAGVVLFLVGQAFYVGLYLWDLHGGVPWYLLFTCLSVPFFGLSLWQHYHSLKHSKSAKALLPAATGVLAFLLGEVLSSAHYLFHHQSFPWFAVLSSLGVLCIALWIWKPSVGRSIGLVAVNTIWVLECLLLWLPAADLAAALS